MLSMETVCSRKEFELGGFPLVAAMAAAEEKLRGGREEEVDTASPLLRSDPGEGGQATDRGTRTSSPKWDGRSLDQSRKNGVGWQKLEGLTSARARWWFVRMMGHRNGARIRSSRVSSKGYC